MKTCDSLILFQILWPMYHPSKSYIVNDPIVPYFTSVESFTNIYKFSTGQGGSYRHKRKNFLFTEIFQFNGTLVMYGVIFLSNGALYEQ